MSLRSLFSNSLLLAVCVVPVRAQSNPQVPNIAAAAAATPTPRVDNVLRVPALKTAQAKQTAGNFVAADPKDPNTVIALRGLDSMKLDGFRRSQLAQRDTTCYALREKRFREPEEGSNIPRPKGSVICTTTSELHLYQLDGKPAVSVWKSAAK